MGKKYLNWDHCFSLLYDIFKLLLDYSARKLPINKVWPASWEAGVLCLHFSCCTTPGLKQGVWVQRSFPSNSEMHGELHLFQFRDELELTFLEKLIEMFSTGKREKKSSTWRTYCPGEIGFKLLCSMSHWPDLIFLA